MSSVPVFVGLDYHQDSVQVCVLTESGERLFNRSVENDVQRVAAAARRYGAPRRLAIEACCGAANLAEALVVQEQLPVKLAHPGYVNRMKQSPDKHDLGDAHLLADLTRVNYLPEVWLAPEETRQLRRLVRYRAQLVNRRRDVKLRIRGLLRENRLRCLTARAWTKAWHEWLGKAELSVSDRWILDQHLDELAQLRRRTEAVEKELLRRTQNDPLVQRLLTLAQVGLVTALTLRAEVGRFDRFRTGKQLARFCGVTPRNASSGARQADAGLIRAGNPELRTVLIELAHRLMRQPAGRWRELAVGLLGRGKPWNVAAAAIANRWVRWLFHEARRPEDLRSGSTKGGPPLPSSPPPRPRGRAKAEATAKTEGARGGSR